MKKVAVFAVIAMLVLLAACGGNQMKAKPLSARTPTAAAVNQAAAPAPQPATEPAPEVTAADAIKELQEQIQNTPVSTGPKTGSTGMPPAPTGVTGKDALLARTRALFSNSSAYGKVEADTEFGPRYDDESDLPEEYQQGGQYDSD
jgi:hypothetical protein